MIILDGLEIKDEEEIDLSESSIRGCKVDSSLIKRFCLSDNLLTSFEICAPNLTVLSLSDNLLTSFEIYAPNLTILSLSGNLLTSFEIQAPNLIWLHLADNPLKVLPLELSQVPKLIHLDLSRTLVSFVDPFLLELAKKHLPNVRKRSHSLGLMEVVHCAFITKGHPVAEQICDNIKE